MELFISKVISSVVEIVLFALIPFVWWLVTDKRKHSFESWIGLKKINGEGKMLFWIMGVSAAFISTGILTLYAIRGVETAASEFSGMGVKALPAIIVYAAFNTAFPEELLFRGFLLKRLQHKFGFTIANVVQSVLFGLLHGVMFFSLVEPVKAVLIVVVTGAIAWFMGYMNEKKANGSILPGWIVHTISNLFSGICAAFTLI